MTSENDRLYDFLKQMQTYVDSLQKTCNGLETKIVGHLDISSERVLQYNKDIEGLKRCCENLSVKAERFNNFVIEHEAKSKGINLLKGWLHWLLTSSLLLMAFRDKLKDLF